MNLEVKNVQDTTKATGPFSVIMYDKDGNVCPVDVYSGGIAQDKEYSEEVN